MMIFKKKWVQWRQIGGRDDGQKQQRTETKAFNLLHIIVSVVRFLCSFWFWMQMESQQMFLSRWRCTRSYLHFYAK